MVPKHIAPDSQGTLFFGGAEWNDFKSTRAINLVLMNFIEFSTKSMKAKVYYIKTFWKVGRKWHANKTNLFRKSQKFDSRKKLISNKNWKKNPYEDKEDDPRAWVQFIRFLKTRTLPKVSTWNKIHENEIIRIFKWFHSDHNVMPHRGPPASYSLKSTIELIFFPRDDEKELRTRNKNMTQHKHFVTIIFLWITI